MSYEKFQERVLAKDGNIKRILAVDGGGLRAVLTVQMLKKIEQIIRDRTKNPKAVLRDYFHLVGGTSTGSMVSALVALGHTADEIEELYLQIGREVFKKHPLRKGLFRAKFPDKAIESGLKDTLKEYSLAEVAEMGIGYCAISKRLDTGSVWPIDNNPHGKYFEARPGSTYVPNKDYKLWQAVRASAAAPGAFSPEIIQVAPDQRGLFLDGGVSPHNYPAYQLFMMATMKGFGYNWEVGEDKLFVLSVGTGAWTRTIKNIDLWDKGPTMATGVRALASMMGDCRELNETTMQWLGKPLTPVDKIDRVIGDLADETPYGKPLFSYTRYNVRIEQEWLKKEFGKDYSDEQIEELRDLGAIPSIPAWQELGKIYADNHVKAEQIL